MEEKLVKQSMDIIMHAGDARLKCTEALKKLEYFEILGAKESIKEALKLIQMAHQIQTDSIQGEMRGEAMDHSLLFTHAQDTLMTVYSEINITKRLISLTESIDARFKKMEERND